MLSRVRAAPPTVLVVVCVLMYFGYFMVAVLGLRGYRTATATGFSSTLPPVGQAVFAVAMLALVRAMHLGHRWAWLTLLLFIGVSLAATAAGGTHRTRILTIVSVRCRRLRH